MSNILKLPIKPKQSKHTHKRIPIKVTYNPDIGVWEWVIITTTETESPTFSADTEAKAIKAAQRYIDKQGLGK